MQLIIWKEAKYPYKEITNTSQSNVFQAQEQNTRFHFNHTSQKRIWNADWTSKLNKAIVHNPYSCWCFQDHDVMEPIRKWKALLYLNGILLNKYRLHYVAWGFTFHNIYEYMCGHKRGINVNFFVWHIHMLHKLELVVTYMYGMVIYWGLVIWKCGRGWGVWLRSYITWWF